MHKNQTKKLEISNWGWTSNEGAPLNVIDYHIFFESQKLDPKILIGSKNLKSEIYERG